VICRTPEGLGFGAIFLLWWYRTVPYRSYVKGWKMPRHYLNQDLATVWLDR